MKKVVAIFFLLTFCFTTKAQTLEWGNVITGDSVEGSQFSFGQTSPRVITVDTDNNSYLLGMFQNIKLKTEVTTRSTIIKYNKTGKQCRHKNFEFQIADIVAEKKTCDIYAISLINKATKIGSDYFQKPKANFSMVLIKMDSALDIQWTRLISDSVFHNGDPAFNFAAMVQLNKKLLISYALGGTFKFKNTIFSVNTKTQKGGLLLSIKKDKTGDSDEWAKQISSTSITNYFSTLSFNKHVQTDPQENIYISLKKTNDTLGTTSNEIFTIDSVNINVKNTSIVKLNSKGKIINILHFDDIFRSSYSILPSGKIFITGSFYLEFNYKNISYKAIPQQADSANFFTSIIVMLDANGEPIWSLREENDSSKGKIEFIHSEVAEGNIYLSGSNYLSSKIGGFTIGKPSNLNGSGVFCKIDTLGNILWLFSAKPEGQSGFFTVFKKFSVDYEGAPIFFLPFKDDLEILDTAIDNIVKGYHTFIFKLTNYFIKRGSVYAGPYCAGDTIYIPYIKNGKFETDNEFIAQLSDDEGEFLGGERELGRIKSITDGVVKGTLPLFNVNTSGNYRIRILSTHPPVQSFYKKDTLRLLIYSRDSANAGNDTTVCRGQSIQLSTTGGSKWDWSPAASLDDSTLFKPIATPKVDTKYRIIISDSSGCGDTDTDYVWVRLRQPLDIQAPFTDSTICRGQSAKLYATGFGGDSTNYNISWYERVANGDVLLNQNTDSISISNSSSAKTFFALLIDNCTTKPDTLFYTINTLAPLKANIVGHKNDTKHLADTLICFDADLKLYAYTTGGKPSQHSISWYGTGFISKAASMVVANAQPQKYYAILSDNCTVLPDTAVIEVKQRQPLNITINAKDSVCSRNPLQLIAINNGGDSTQYQVNWITNNTNWISNQNPTQHSPTAITTYIATLSDNCSPTANDTFTVKVLPLPTPQFTFDKTYGCPPLQVNYTDKSKGNLPTQNRWIIDNRTTIPSPNTSKLFSKTAITTAKLIITNQSGCTDSISKSEQINIFRKPQVQFVVTPARLEVEEPITFTSTSNEAIKYQWDLGDGILDYGKGTVKKIFNNEGYQTIILVAENSLGCKDTAYKTIQVFEKVYCAIPNAFTPNGDGLNNTFAPVCEGISDYTLTIYNRWGQVIHKSRNGVWDGTYANSPAPEGVYMYKIHIHAQSKNKSMVYGSVNVIR